MAQVRTHQKATRAVEYQSAFNRYCSDDGLLELSKVDEAMAAVYIMGANRLESDLQRRLVYEWDVDNSGDFSLSEFTDICQCVQERLASSRMEETVRHATKLGIKKSRLGEFLWAFDQHDINRSDSLSKREIVEVLQVTTTDPPTKRELKEYFNQSGIKPETEATLEQYLKFMHIATEGRGTYRREKPFTLRDVPRDRLREVLAFFPLAESYIEQLDFPEIAEIASGYLRVPPHFNMRELPSDPVGNVRQLFAYAAKCAKDSGASRDSSHKPKGGALGRLGGILATALF